ncbi:hypothetical protein EFR01_57250 [Sinorhizobium fredii]|nr:hypothetical protein EFR01_57250 [Sinorhizobium fredii]GLS11954.1 hypothetical protein GCM10007864_55860 [Sinorhizobium fredii]
MVSRYKSPKESLSGNVASGVTSVPDPIAKRPEAKSPPPSIVKMRLCSKPDIENALQACDR